MLNAFYKNICFHVTDNTFWRERFPKVVLTYARAHIFSRNQQLRIQRHEFYMDRQQIRGRSCARMIYSAQDGGPINGQKKSRPLSAQSTAYALSLCREQNNHFHVLQPWDLRSGGKPHISRLPTIIIMKKEWIQQQQQLQQQPQQQPQQQQQQ